AVNKWDLVEEKDSNTAVRGEEELRTRAPFLAFIPFLYVSAKTGQRVTKLPDLILEVAEERAKRVPTAEVNRVLESLLDRQQPPQPVGESVRLLYASQIGTAPPAPARFPKRADPPRRDPRVVYALPPERLPRGLAVHGLPGEPQVPPQAGDGPPMNDYGLAVMLLLAYLIGATPTSYVAGKLG